MFITGEDGFVVGGMGFEEVEDDACEFVGCGGDGLWGAKASPHAAEVVTDGGVAPAGAVVGHAEGVGSAGFDGAGMSGENPAAGEALVGTEAEPRGEVF